MSLAASTAAGACLSSERYGEILTSYTAEVEDTAGVRVNYGALREAPVWERLVADLDHCDPGQLRSHAERLAFWTNAYNVLAIDLVTRNHPAESIRELGSLFRPVWKREAGSIGGRSYSLDEIEHEILRPMGEPRIHAAIVCASTSCPSLRREPYRASRLDLQLDDSLRRWLADPRKGARIDRGKRTLFLSRIFDWFAEDFESRGGVLAFLRPYFPGPIRRFVEAQGDALRVRYLEYDWRLNDLRGRDSMPDPRQAEER
jgi:hypothetical protein